MKYKAEDSVINYLEKISSEYQNTAYLVAYCMNNNMDYSKQYQEAIKLRIKMDIILTEMTRGFSEMGQVSVDFNSKEVTVGA